MRHAISCHFFDIMEKCSEESVKCVTGIFTGCNDECEYYKIEAPIMITNHVGLY